ncbi:MAG: inositol monophosphatase [Verrucomicrobiota bacterium]|nr:inositol monophosphatase [Verrucomicrobiota bacterium]
MAPHLEVAQQAARAAGELLRSHFEKPLTVHATTAHDIKLEVDVLAQDLITRILLERFPDHALYGEEGIVGDQASAYQWVVDPLDGTVNFFFGIPHFCVSIALRLKGEVIVGVIYDPIRNELWSAEKGGEPSLNGKAIRVSPRATLAEAVVSIGLAKTSATIDAGLPLLEQMVHRVRKCRMMGSAALDMAYISCGRLDAYIEQGISLWDIAAGSLLVELAGGKVELEPRTDMPDKFRIIASNGRLDLR